MMIKVILTVFMVFVFIPVFAVALPEDNTQEVEKIITTEEPINSIEQVQPSHAITSPIEQDTRTQPSPVIESTGDTFEFPLLRTFGGLGLVLCLIIALFFAGKKYFPQYFQKAVSEKNLKILETLSMGDKRSIALIEIADKHFLVGNTPNQINLLTSFSKSISLTSESDDEQMSSQGAEKKEFRNLYEVEKERPATHSASPLSEDVWAKMRLLREALEK